MDGCGFKDSSAETLKCFLIRLEGIFLTRNSLHVFVITYLQALYLGPFQLIFQGFESCFQGGWLCRHLLFLEYFEGYEKKTKVMCFFCGVGMGGGRGGLLSWYYSGLSVLLDNPGYSRFMDRISRSPDQSLKSHKADR